MRINRTRELSFCPYFKDKACFSSIKYQQRSSAIGRNSVARIVLLLYVKGHWKFRKWIRVNFSCLWTWEKFISTGVASRKSLFTTLKKFQAQFLIIKIEKLGVFVRSGIIYPNHEYNQIGTFLVFFNFNGAERRHRCPDVASWLIRKSKRKS